MGRKHYLFQKKNPYTSDVTAMEGLSPSSPTFKVSGPNDVQSIGRADTRVYLSSRQKYNTTPRTTKRGTPLA
jgi:hypothetical protein